MRLLGAANHLVALLMRAIFAMHLLGLPLVCRECPVFGAFILGLGLPTGLFRLPSYAPGASAFLRPSPIR